ncbi:hypothetical protein NRB_23020 [Novosphingobium sp. 11B]
MLVRIAPTVRNRVRPQVSFLRSEKTPTSGSQTITHSFGIRMTKPDSQGGMPRMVVMKIGSRTAGVSRKICAPS